MDTLIHMLDQFSRHLFTYIYIYFRCSCARCGIMPSVEECRCCREIPKFREFCDAENTGCITTVSTYFFPYIFYYQSFHWLKTWNDLFWMFRQWCFGLSQWLFWSVCFVAQMAHCHMIMKYWANLGKAWAISLQYIYRPHHFKEGANFKFNEPMASKMIPEWL